MAKVLKDLFYGNLDRPDQLMAACLTREEDA